MRYYLDTNIVIFMIFGEDDQFSKKTKNILSDYSTQLKVSSVAVAELIHLFHYDKISSKKIKDTTGITNLLISKYNIDVVPFNQHHLKTLESLKVNDNHKDPFDHIIVSQAINDKIQLISSDSKFESYKRQHLKLVYNNKNKPI